MNTNHTPGPWAIDAGDMEQDDDTVFSLGIWAGEGDDRAMVTCVSAFGLRSETNGGTEYVLATAPGQSELDEAKANARLISAAPLLLDALQAITDDYADLFDLDDPRASPGIKSMIEQARAAIAAATN